MNYTYDVNSNVNHKDYTLFNNTYKLDYEFNEDDSVIKVKFDNNSLNYDYDYLGRLKSRNINGHIPEYFTYKRNGNKTSLMVDTMKIDNDTYKYYYDDLYNITEILKNDEILNKYTYDNRSQLLSDENHDLNKKYIYTYDNEGNILTKKEYNLETNALIKTDTFTYGNDSWEDQLTKFNNETITYDAIGNPTSIGSKILSWSNGRQLSSYKDDNTIINYTYNQNGIRTVKLFGESGEDGYINYYLEGTKIIFEERCKFIDGEKVINMLYYIYDDSGNVLGFKYNNTLYYYQKNNQNDIIGIYDSNYNLVVTYKYDAWGKVISVTDTTTDNIGTINPFRYRSYYYDEETKLYYLNSRYYNPEWCRFINADNYLKVSILGNNLYIYTENNSVTAIDTKGTFFKKVGDFFKGCYNKAKDVVVDTYNNCKKFVSSSAKKIGKTVKSGFNFVKQNFVLEIGTGTGFSAEEKTTLGKIGLSDSTNIVSKWTYNGEEEYIESTRGVSLGIAGASQTLVDLEAENLENYPTTFNVGPLEFSNNSRTIFIGYSKSLHIYVGGYLKIGVEIKW